MSYSDKPENLSKLESLSALMDGESNELELRRTLRTASEEGELSETWRRYHLAQSLMKGQAVESTIDISVGVMAAIESEEQTAAEPELAKPQTHWWQGAASMAAAASVTLAVLLGVQQFSGQKDVTGMQQAGVIERAGATSALVPTSLSGVTDNTSGAEAIEVIRLSEDMRRSISQYQTTLASLSPSWQPDWLPEGYTAAGVQLDGATTTRLYSKSGELLTLAVEPLTEQSPAPGSYSQAGLTALGRVVEQHFVSLVGQVSLDEADRVISSLQWQTTVH